MFAECLSSHSNANYQVFFTLFVKALSLIVATDVAISLLHKFHSIAGNLFCSHNNVLLINFNLVKCNNVNVFSLSRLLCASNSFVLLRAANTPEIKMGVTRQIILDNK